MAQELTTNWPTLATEWFQHHEQVVTKVAGQWPTVPREIIYDAFVDALLQITADPTAFDASRGSIAAFLTGATTRVVRDKHRSATARQRREEKKGEMLVASRQAAAREVVDVLADEELAPLARASAALTDEERRYLALWEQGIKEPTELAAALDIGHMPADQQAAETRRAHKRLMKRLERFGARQTGEEDCP